MTELETVLTFTLTGAVLIVAVLYGGARAIEAGHHHADEAADRRRWERSTRIEEHNRRADLRFVQRAENSRPPRLGRALRAVLAREHLAESAGDDGELDFDAHAAEALGIAGQPSVPPPLPHRPVVARLDDGLPPLSTADRAALHRDLHRLIGEH